MKAIVKDYFKAELCKAKTAAAERDFEAAWIALQRAHILGQTDEIAHTVAHWHMLKLAWRQRDFREVIAGQLIQTLLAFPLTVLFGQMRALRGGRANVKGSERMTVPEDIQQILNQ
ncbi:DUF3703 domain-containing protein [Romeria aff. gracilis LEGE 07310]|uniref:DUF3703 domain-containing protein n=1 Tax=Vasconcelosia minhoensis LEGE 07310 TaxID=915328 RepID=A0A8J7AH97_9CYAN|nr:DUF3703 domain-containing protein [Romeria gracilis]MBE9079106.1 DUF3703 domain-containing protein [Romeria aff. gracilis LEGE 07310]